MSGTCCAGGQAALMELGVDLQGNVKSRGSGLNMSYHQMQAKHWWTCPVCRAGSFLGRSTTVTGQTDRIPLLKAHAEHSGHKLIIPVLPLVDLT